MTYKSLKISEALGGFGWFFSDDPSTDTISNVLEKSESMISEKLRDKNQTIEELANALAMYGNTDNWSKQYYRQGRIGHQIKRELHTDGGKRARNVLDRNLETILDAKARR